MKQVSWPDSKLFAFTIFDDTDLSTLANVETVYSFLENCGLRITKSVWPIKGNKKPSIGGDTCENPEYLQWAKALQKKGFEIGFHLATFHTSQREQTQTGLEKFRQLFGHWPKSMSNHADCSEGIYFGAQRLNYPNKLIYNLLTRARYRNYFRGHLIGDPVFWGDYCQKYVRYVRNFVFRDINTLKECPFMPYHDLDRPYVNWWFASSEGPTVESFNRTISEENQDRLETEGGACIMYSHLASGFYQDGYLNSRFKDLMERLSKKKGWFVPVSTLLDYLMEQDGEKVLTPRERMLMEVRWLIHKLQVGYT